MICLSLSTVTFDKFDDNRFSRTFELTPRTPFRYVEFNCWHARDYSPASVRYLLARCEACGLTPSAMYGGPFGGANPHELSLDVSHKLRLVDMARETGCRRIVATGGGRGTAGGLAAIITVLREIVPYAEEKGVLVCLENHASNNLETIEDYEEIFAAIPSPNLGLCVDTGHFDASGIELDDVADRLASRINHIHVKEAEAKGTVKFVPFGTGSTDNNRFIERMIDLGYSGFVSVEYVALDMSRPLEEILVPWEMFSRYLGA